jgi:hypothetical protein
LFSFSFTLYVFPGHFLRPLITPPLLFLQAVPPFHFAAYMTIPDRWNLWRFVALGTTFVQLAAYDWGRRLLLEYPRFFTWGLFTKAGEKWWQSRLECCM